MEGRIAWPDLAFLENGNYGCALMQVTQTIRLTVRIKEEAFHFILKSERSVTRRRKMSSDR